MPASCLPVSAPVSIGTVITIAIATPATVEVVIPVTSEIVISKTSLTSEVVCESRPAIASTTIPPAVSRVVTVNKLSALPIEV